MDTSHHSGELVITSVKGYLWFLTLNIIFSTWLVLRTFGGGVILFHASDYTLTLYMIIIFSLANLLLTIRVGDAINEGVCHFTLPVVVLIFGLLWSAIFYHLLLDFQKPTLIMVILAMILLPAVIAFYISGKLLTLFSTPIVVALICGEVAATEKFTLMQYLGGAIIMAVVISARFILLESYLQVRQSESEKNALILKLVRLANHDNLTGLFNRHSLNDYFVQKTHQLDKTKESLFIIILDIDFFKQYNDIYGHMAGDKCLVQVSKSIELSLRREQDAAFRLGGEEFMVAVVCSKMEDTMKIAKRIQHAVCADGIRHKGSMISDRITLSQGIAQWHPHMSLEMLLELADKALYQAKLEGRNRICFEQSTVNSLHSRT